MKKLQNILYVTTGISSGRDGLIQALSIARNNNATLRILAIYPEFVDKVPEYMENFKTILIKQVETLVHDTCVQLAIKEDDLQIDITAASFAKPAIQIIQNIIRENTDLLIKEVDGTNIAKGFKAIDMELLRKCPCPIWLSRPITRPRNEISVAVAIDPNIDEEVAHALNKRLLELARSIADTCNQELKIISCWDCENEEYLKNSPWISISSDELKAMVYETKTNHLATLNHIVKESSIGGNNEIVHLRGQPAKIIPEYINENKIDVLVMGTVARTGIPSFIIGNTAEDILQQLSCTLVALKPNGFITPVQPY